MYFALKEISVKSYMEKLNLYLLLAVVPFTVVLCYIVFFCVVVLSLFFANIFFCYYVCSVEVYPNVGIKCILILKMELRTVKKLLRLALLIPFFFGKDILSL